MSVHLVHSFQNELHKHVSLACCKYVFMLLKSWILVASTVLLSFSYLFMSFRQQNWPLNFYPMTRLWTSVKLSGHGWFSSESTAKYVCFIFFSGIETHSVNETQHWCCFLFSSKIFRFFFLGKIQQKKPTILPFFICVLREKMVLSMC